MPYSQPARAFRRRQQDAQMSREIDSYYGSGEKILLRVGSYLEREFSRACLDRDLVRRAALKGAMSVLKAAVERVLTDTGECPF